MWAKVLFIFNGAFGNWGSRWEGPMGYMARLQKGPYGNFSIFTGAVDGVADPNLLYILGFGGRE